MYEAGEILLGDARPVAILLFKCAAELRMPGVFAYN